MSTPVPAASAGPSNAYESADAAARTRVTVVIPNWNGLEHLEGCFGALRRQTLSGFEVAFVDNASTDGSVAWVRAHAPEARIILMPENAGFGKAVNAGIRAADSEFVALLNNDTIADPGWLEHLVAALDGSPCYEAAACRMMLHDEPGTVNSAGDLFSFWRLAGVNRGLGEPAEGYLERKRVFGVCAGAALYRRSFFDTVGLFDEDFFLLHEDTDLNLRAAVIGVRCLYVPDAVVLHKHHGSLDKQPQRRLQILEWRNKAALSAKSLPQPLLFLAPAMYAAALLRWALPLRPRNWHLARERWGMFRELRRAALDGWADGKSKRAAVQTARTVSDSVARRWILRGVGPFEECER